MTSIENQPDINFIQTEHDEAPKLKPKNYGMQIDPGKFVISMNPLDSEETKVELSKYV